MYKVDTKSQDIIKSLRKGKMASFFFACDTKGTKAGLVAMKAKDKDSDTAKSRGTKMRDGELKVKKFCRGIIIGGGDKGIIFVRYGGNISAKRTQKLLREVMSKKVPKIGPMLKKAEVVGSGALSNDEELDRLGIKDVVKSDDKEVSAGFKAELAELQKLEELDDRVINREIEALVKIHHESYEVTVEQVTEAYEILEAVRANTFTELSETEAQELVDRAVENQMKRAVALAEAISTGDDLFTDDDEEVNEEAKTLIQLSQEIIKRKFRGMNAGLIGSHPSHLKPLPIALGLNPKDGVVSFYGREHRFWLIDHVLPGMVWHGTQLPMKLIEKEDLRPLVEIIHKLPTDAKAIFDKHADAFLGDHASISKPVIEEMQKMIAGHVKDFRNQLDRYYKKPAGQDQKIFTPSTLRMVEKYIFSVTEFIDYLNSEEGLNHKIFTMAGTTAVPPAPDEPDPEYDDFDETGEVAKAKAMRCKYLLQFQRRGLTTLVTGDRGNAFQKSFNSYAYKIAWTSNRELPDIVWDGKISADEFFSKALKAKMEEEMDYTISASAPYSYDQGFTFGKSPQQKMRVINVLRAHGVPVSEQAMMEMVDYMKESIAPKIKQRNSAYIQQKLDELGVESVNDLDFATSQAIKPPLILSSSMLVEILRDPSTADQFIAFANTHLCVENVMFVVAVRPDLAHLRPRFSALADMGNTKGVTRCRWIYDFFVDPSSDLTINIAGGPATALKIRYDEGTMAWSVVKEYQDAYMSINQNLTSDTLRLFYTSIGYNKKR